MLKQIDTLRPYRKKLNELITDYQENIIMEQGCYPKLSIDDYHSSEGLSSSGVTKILDTPYKYWYEYLSGQYKRDEEESRALVIGQGVHTASLEPDFFHDRFVMRPDGIDRRTKQGKEDYAAFECEAQGKTILSGSEYQTVTNMAKSVRNNKALQNLIKSDMTYIEHSIYWQDKEFDCLLKSRPDFYNHFLILDLKTTRSAKQSDFERAIFQYGYHRQAAMALDALTALTGWEYTNFVILAVEKQPPYLTALYRLDKTTIEQGRIEYKRAVKLFKECKEANVWPGYPEKVIDICLPAWAIAPELLQGATV